MLKTREIYQRSFCPNCQRSLCVSTADWQNNDPHVLKVYLAACVSNSFANNILYCRNHKYKKEPFTTGKFYLITQQVIMMYV